MCGIFGAISQSKLDKIKINKLAKSSQRRGKDSSGLFFFSGEEYSLWRATKKTSSLIKDIKDNDLKFLMGHSRLITNGLEDNQPVFQNNICVIHNGIIVNEEEIWENSKQQRKQKIDTELIAAITKDCLDSGLSLEEIPKNILKKCYGVVACAIALPELGKLMLFSNNGSLFFGEIADTKYFASEKYFLQDIGCTNISQIFDDGVFVDIPNCNDISIDEFNDRNIDLIPGLGTNFQQEKLLEYEKHNLKRCTKCILPETMPFITFNDKGVCNYCTNYTLRNTPRPIEELQELIQPYLRKNESDCLVPFSGGRDSSYGLHLMMKTLKVKPIAYTYDWGMVTDLGRRNISRMCSKLGVENIVVADDIEMKRRNIAMNFKAWLKNPDLGMVNILMAGDKHFFRHIETVKKETNISLNIWSINPLEVTHFKAGFLGIPPYFDETLVYTHGVMKQLRYQSLRFLAMTKSLGYFNSSLWDTLSGEYYRSFKEKTDYYHLFDYWRWDEKEIEDTLVEEYDWELAPDTKTSWRIGDGSAALYNYIYYLVAGFTEHDTFRSNQIREGDITREEALKLVHEENKPRYPNIKWYLDSIGFDYKEVVKRINQIEKIKPF